MEALNVNNSHCPKNVYCFVMTRGPSTGGAHAIIRGHKHMCSRAASRHTDVLVHKWRAVVWMLGLSYQLSCGTAWKP
eukprot:364743-Chlamydomonas_euryale.AAC.67